MANFCYWEVRKRWCERSGCIWMDDDAGREQASPTPFPDNGYIDNDVNVNVKKKLVQASVLLFFKREQVNIDIQDVKNMRKRDTSILCVSVCGFGSLSICAYVWMQIEI